MINTPTARASRKDDRLIKPRQDEHIRRPARHKNPITAQRRIRAIKNRRVVRAIHIQPPLPVRQATVPAAPLERLFIGMQIVAVEHQEGGALVHQAGARGVGPDEVVVERLGAGHLARRQDAGLGLYALDGGDELAALRLGDAAPLAPELEVGEVAAGLEVREGFGEGQRVEAFEGEARVDGCVDEGWDVGGQGGGDGGCREAEGEFGELHCGMLRLVGWTE